MTSKRKISKAEIRDWKKLALIEELKGNIERAKAIRISLAKLGVAA